MNRPLYLKAKELQDSIDYYNRALEKITNESGYGRILHISLIGKTMDTQTVKLDVDAELSDLLTPMLAAAEEFIKRRLAALNKEFIEL